jgi:cation diffusion facilitator CzcD-associated flavoprotein CzcO
MRRETASECYYLGERAIVVGGGLGGLSAARALSDRFRQVVVLDRDELPDGATPRRSVPQGKHPHLLFPLFSSVALGIENTKETAR